ncbi:hypothetical protein Tco_0180724 [Tanacetum coccineum]
MPANEEHSISLGQLHERPMKEPTLDAEGRYGDGAARTKCNQASLKEVSNRGGATSWLGSSLIANSVARNFLTLMMKSVRLLKEAGLEELRKDLYVRREDRKNHIEARAEIYEKGIKFTVEIMTSGLAKGTGLKASLMSYLTKLKEFQFPKQPSPKQQLEPIQLMKEDLPSRKGLKAS